MDGCACQASIGSLRFSLLVFSGRGLCGELLCFLSTSKLERTNPYRTNLGKDKSVAFSLALHYRSLFATCNCSEGCRFRTTSCALPITQVPPLALRRRRAKKKTTDSSIGAVLFTAAIG